MNRQHSTGDVSEPRVGKKRGTTIMNCQEAQEDNRLSAAKLKKKQRMDAAASAAAASTNNPDDGLGSSSASCLESASSVQQQGGPQQPWRGQEEAMKTGAMAVSQLACGGASGDIPSNCPVFENREYSQASSQRRNSVSRITRLPSNELKHCKALLRRLEEPREADTNDSSVNLSGTGATHPQGQGTTSSSDDPVSSVARNLHFDSLLAASCSDIRKQEQQPPKRDNDQCNRFDGNSLDLSNESGIRHLCSSSFTTLLKHKSVRCGDSSDLSMPRLSLASFSQVALEGGGNQDGGKSAAGIAKNNALASDNNNDHAAEPNKESGPNRTINMVNRLQQVRKMRKRQNDVVYARQRRQREKELETTLKKEVAELQQQNSRSRHVCEQLNQLLIAAKAIVFDHSIQMDPNAFGQQEPASSKQTGSNHESNPYGQSSERHQQASSSIPQFLQGSNESFKPRADAQTFTGAQVKMASLKVDNRQLVQGMPQNDYQVAAGTKVDEVPCICPHDSLIFQTAAALSQNQQDTQASFVSPLDDFIRKIQKQQDEEESRQDQTQLQQKQQSDHQQKQQDAPSTPPMNHMKAQMSEFTEQSFAFLSDTQKQDLNRIVQVAKKGPGNLSSLGASVPVDDFKNAPSNDTTRNNPLQSDQNVNSTLSNLLSIAMNEGGANSSRGGTDALRQFDQTQGSVSQMQNIAAGHIKSSVDSLVDDYIMSFGRNKQASEIANALNPQQSSSTQQYENSLKQMSSLDGMRSRSMPTSQSNPSNVPGAKNFISLHAPSGPHQHQNRVPQPDHPSTTQDARAQSSMLDSVKNEKQSARHNSAAVDSFPSQFSPLSSNENASGDFGVSVPTGLCFNRESDKPNQNMFSSSFMQNANLLSQIQQRILQQHPSQFQLHQLNPQLAPPQQQRIQQQLSQNPFQLPQTQQQQPPPPQPNHQLPQPENSNELVQALQLLRMLSTRLDQETLRALLLQAHPHSPDPLIQATHLLRFLNSPGDNFFRSFVRQLIGPSTDSLP